MNFFRTAWIMCCVTASSVNHWFKSVLTYDPYTRSNNRGLMMSTEMVEYELHIQESSMSDILRKFSEPHLVFAHTDGSIEFNYFAGKVDRALIRNSFRDLGNLVLEFKTKESMDQIENVELDEGFKELVRDATLVGSDNEDVVIDVGAINQLMRDKYFLASKRYIRDKGKRI